MPPLPCLWAPTIRSADVARVSEMYIMVVTVTELTYLLTYLLTYVRTDMRTYVRTYVCPYVRTRFGVFL